jgi:hypothetical protein
VNRLRIKAMAAAWLAAGATFAAATAHPGLETVVLRNGLTFDRLERTGVPLV